MTDPIQAWQQYLTKIWDSTFPPTDKPGKDAVIGEMHGEDFGGEPLICDVIRSPDGVFRTAYPMRTCLRFKLPRT